MVHCNWYDIFTDIVVILSSPEVLKKKHQTIFVQMHAEFQVLSPLVPVRQVKFIRFCKQNAKDLWAVVDVSVDAIQEGSRAHVDCRRLPSGCVIQDLPNGYSKVIGSKDYVLFWTCP